jgi:hypothetical protein
VCDLSGLGKNCVLPITDLFIGRIKWQLVLLMILRIKRYPFSQAPLSDYSLEWKSGWFSER